MANSGDKFHPFLIPNCHRTASQEAKLQPCLFAREPKPSSYDILIQSSSSPDEPPEQPTGIEMVSLPDSFDEYQTPPEQPYSQNSSNDGHVAATKPAPFDENRVVDLANELDNLDTEPIDVEDHVDEVEAVDTEVISSPEGSAHQVFDKTPQREQDNNKRKLPVLMRTRKESSKYLKHGVFKDVVNRVLKMVEIVGGGGGGGDDDGDFVEAAKKRGLSLPRPRWWPTEGFED